MEQLAGKAAIVTGGGRGIGRSIALAFAQAGADVCVTARTQSQLDEVSDGIRQLGRKGLAVVCDVSDRRQVDAAVETAAAELGRIDILVNTAGGGQERTNVGDDDPEAWRDVIDVNLLGTYYFSRAILPHLRKSGGGAIINVGSGMGHEARGGNSSYNAAKAAVWMFTRCLAMEVWQDNIAVNELIPGPVYTELTAKIFQLHTPHPAVQSEWVKQPDDVAPFALLMASQDQHGPTGQSFSLARRPL